MAPVAQATDPINTHQKMMPPSLQWHQPRFPSMSITRDRYEIQSAEATYSPGGNGNNRVRFQIPNDNIYDFQRGSVEFTVTFTQAAANSAWFSQGIYTIFSRTMIRGPDLIEENREYGLYHSTLAEHFSKLGATTAGELWGFGSQADRQGWANGTTKTYRMPLLMGMLKSQVWPAKFIKQDVWVELELGDYARILEGTTVGTSFTLTNCKLRCDAIFGEEYTNYVGGVCAAGGLNFSFKGYEYFQSDPWNSTTKTLLIQSRAAAVDNFFIILQPDTYATTTANLDKFLVANRHNVLNVQMKREGRFWPSQPILVNNHDLYLEYLRLLDTWSLTGVWKDGPLIAPADFVNNRFLISLEVNPYQGDGMISPKGTSGYNVDTQVVINHSAIPGVNIVARIIVPCYHTVVLGSNGRFAQSQ